MGRKGGRKKKVKERRNEKEREEEREGERSKCHERDSAMLVRHRVGMMHFRAEGGGRATVPHLISAQAKMTLHITAFEIWANREVVTDFQSMGLERDSEKSAVALRSVDFSATTIY